MNMADNGKREPVILAEQERLPLATFKNSLRLWQARWKAQQASEPAAASCLKENRQPASPQ
jgi:hypothetical protein